ncbi:MAG: DUF1549 domain-containing protein [Pirellulaceae bacterium]
MLAHRTSVLVLIATASLILTGYAASALANDATAAANQLQGLLETHCNHCHGSQEQEGDIRFDQLTEGWEALFSSGLLSIDSPEDGELSQLIHDRHASELHMPPERPLAESVLAQFDLALRSLHPSAPPTTPLSGDWLLEPLEATETGGDDTLDLDPAFETTQPSDAIRLKSLRTVYLDLTGLPPSAAELRAYRADSRPDALVRQVDRLLASPSFGERWTRYWMDQVRYGDSEGFDIDQPRPHAWRYRTWLIDAFNQDQRFDQFTFGQLAADSVSNESNDSIGLGFLSQSTRNTEAGADREEDLVRRSCDRLEATADIWLGLQLRCARCHDHPFQPITQVDYYQLLALFRNLDDAIVPAPTEAIVDRYEREWPSLEQQIKRLEATRETYRTKIAARSFLSWRARTSFNEPTIWLPLPIESAVAETGETLEVLVDQSVLATGPLPDFAEYRVVGRPGQKSITGIRLDCLPIRPFPTAVRGVIPIATIWFRK